MINSTHDGGDQRLAPMVMRTKDLPTHLYAMQYIEAKAQYYIVIHTLSVKTLEIIHF